MSLLDFERLFISFCQCHYSTLGSLAFTVVEAEPALVSAGPWQGLDATASAERETIRGSVVEPAAGIQGHSPRWRVRGALQSRA